MEEENSDYFHRVLTLLNTLRNVTDTSVFMLCIWRSLLLCTSSRLAALNYLTVVIPKTPIQMMKYLSQPPMLSIHALLATLQDQNVLAQRKLLELIITHFPLRRVD